jgi:diguanylate cyclase (GGDEF)-like protein/PAS domain S-box-containing protein
MLLALFMLCGNIAYSQYREYLTIEMQQSMLSAMNQAMAPATAHDPVALFTQWRQQTLRHASAFLVLVVVAVFILLVHQRRQRIAEALAGTQEQLLRTSEAKLHSFFDATPDALLISDAQGTITINNHQAEQLLGYAVHELVGMSIDDLVPRHVRQKHPALRQAFAATPDARRMGYGMAVQARRKNGTEFDVEVSLNRIVTEEGQFFACALRDITERNQAQEQLRIAAVAFESHQGVVVSDANNFVLRVNQAFTKITGYTAQESVGRHMDFLKSDRHDASFWKEIWHTILRDGAWEGEIWNRKKNGEIHPHWLTIATVKDSKDVITHFIGTYTDITEIKMAEADLRVAAVAFESNQAMIITDSNNDILRINRTFTEITGYTTQEVIGKNPRIFKSGTHDAEFYCAMWRSIESTGAWNGEIWDKRKNGELYPKWMTISAVKDDSGKVTHYVGSHFDISERKKSEELINSLAFFDQLTGLPNRTLLIDRLKQTMTASGRSGHHCALLFIDLDHFKSLNDTLGHDMGDLLLQQVAQRLTQQSREGDTVSRLGGDEFVVVLASLGESQTDAAVATETVAQKFLDALNQSYTLRDVSHRSTASIGATVFLGQKISIDELMKQADLALYRSKDSGRNALHFFDPSMELAVKKRVDMEADLRQALLSGQFLLHYQAQITNDDRVTGAEVLLRWQHPVQGMVSPAEFIALAEETGLILPLGLWVLKTACDQLTQWALVPELAHLTIAVNVSVHQFNDKQFVPDVLALLNASKVKPEQLKLELTESLMAGKMEVIIEKMNLLKARGLKFSLDDFGTGYSSLSYLNRLPLDQLKIDQSFVRDVLTDHNDAVIAKSIVALGQSLGLNVIAEGVETHEQRRFLADSGCLVYQGYLFSRPVPVDDFVRLVQTNGCRNVSPSMVGVGQA